MKLKIPFLIFACTLIFPAYSQNIIKDLIPGTASSSPKIYAVLPGGFIFYANSSTSGKEPWFSDGTEQGTIMLKDIQAGVYSSDYPSNYVVLGNNCYFIARIQGNFNIGLWKTDGTVNGTLLVKDLGTIVFPPGGLITPLPMIASNGKIYFVYEDYRGKELWVSDGTANGTDVVMDINTGPTGSSPSGLTVFGSYLYFFANDGANGNELWRTDGNVTELFKDIYPGSISSFTGTPSLFVFKNKMYFGAQGTHDEGVEVYSTDGTPQGTGLFKDINTDIQGGSFPAFIEAGENYFLFRAKTTAAGDEPWISDGTASGTKLLIDINTGSGSAYPTSGMALGNKLVFSVYTPAEGSELWVTDGTTQNTKRLRNISPGNLSGYAGQMRKSGNLIYFLGSDSTGGTEIWETDGSESGTILNFEVNPGSAGSGIVFMHLYNGKLYFNASKSADQLGDELYSLQAQSNSITPFGTSAHFNLYPNPLAAGSTLYINSTEKDVMTDVSILDAKGQTILEASNINGEIVLPGDLSPGIYLVLIKRGNILISRNIMIE